MVKFKDIQEQLDGNNVNSDARALVTAFQEEHGVEEFGSLKYWIDEIEQQIEDGDLA